MLAPFHPSIDDGGARRSVYAGLRDSFSGSSLNARWSTYKPASITAAVSGGRVRLTPTQGGAGATGSFWYSASNVSQNDGGLIYQAVGPAVGTPVSFDARARVRVFAADGTSQVRETVGEWRFGGLAVHDPTRTSYYRYLHVALGSEGGAGVSGIECKVNRVNVTGGASIFPVANIVGDLERDIRIVRRATDTDLFDLFDKPATGLLTDGTGWTRRYTVRWTDGADADDDFDATPQETDDPFPDDVQIGLMSYSNAVGANIVTDCLDFWIGPTAL